jgi:hypothetical protein
MSDVESKTDTAPDVAKTPDRGGVDPSDQIAPGALPPIEPPFDDELRQVAIEWIAGGLIGSSIRDGTRSESYLNITKFDLTPLELTQNFRFWHADNLLDDAAALIDRFLIVQDQWRDKLARSFQVECEVIQYLDNEKTYASEVANGLYDTPFVEAAQTSLSEEKGLKYSDDAVSFASNLYQTIYSSAAMTAQNGNALFSGWLSTLPTYASQGSGDQLRYKITYADSTSYTDTKPELYSMITKRQSEFQMSIGDSSTGLDLSRARGTAESARIRLIGLKKRADWEKVNQAYRRARTDAARKAAEAKVGAFTLAGGALNYREQMAELAARMTRDASDALARLDKARDGLAKVYGHDVPFPPSVKAAIDSGKASHLAMHEASGWVRDAIGWLARFRELDQNYVLPLSVKALTGDGWAAGQGAGSWNIPISEALFDAQRFVRIRGLRAYAYGVTRDQGSWSVGISLPKEAKVNYGAGWQALAQADLPRILLPRTTARGDGPDSEMVGMLAAFNTSPVGTWQLTASLQSSQGVPLSSVRDIEIEVALAVQATA